MGSDWSSEAENISAPLASSLSAVGPAPAMDFAGAGLVLGCCPAIALAPFCTCKDLGALAVSNSCSAQTLVGDQAWRELLVQQFFPIFQVLLRAQSGVEDDASDIETQQAEVRRLVVRLSRKNVRHAVALITTTNAKPFELQPRARLSLEIHELKAWTRQERSWKLLRQATCLDSVLFPTEEGVSSRLFALMTPVAMDLLALKALVVGPPPSGPPGPPSPGAPLGTQAASPQWLVDTARAAGIEWNPTTDAEFHSAVQALLHLRRNWWQKQRNFLLQDLYGELGSPPQPSARTV